jgi:hypothetical protein
MSLNYGCPSFMNKVFIILLLFFSVNTIVFAEIFKWTDEKGNVHYGDKPTSTSQQLDINEEESSPRPVNKSDETRVERRRKLTEAMTEDRLDKEKKKSQEKKKKAKLSRKCMYAKDTLRRNEKAGSLYNFDKQGNRYTLSDEQRIRSIKSLKKKINKYCR